MFLFPPSCIRRSAVAEEECIEMPKAMGAYTLQDRKISNHKSQIPSFENEIKFLN